MHKKNARNAFILFVVLVCLATGVSLVFSSPYQDVSIGDWKYEAVEKLALRTGCTQFIFNIKPWTEKQMKEIINCVEQKGEELDEGMDFLLQGLKGELENRENKLFQLKQVKNQFMLSDRDYFKENNFGDKIREDVGTRTDVTLEGMPSQDLSYSLTPRLEFNSRDGSLDSQLLRGNIKYQFKNVEFTLGRQSNWWGAGYHGTWVMTNNAFPIDGIEISNVEPFKLRYLGHIKTTLFWGKLSKQVLSFSDIFGNRFQKVVRPQYIALRGDVSLTPWLEGGLTLSSLAAGKLTSVGLREIWRALFPVDIAETARENDLDTSLAATDRVGSLDITLRIPKPERFFNELKALKIYWERGAEDYRRGSVDTLTWLYSFGAPADQLGVYLGFPRSDFRFEYATNVHGNVTWYTHSQFTEGYTNRGSIMGHHMGGQGRGVFYQLVHGLNHEMGLGLDFQRIKTFSPGRGVGVVVQNQEKTAVKLELHDRPGYRYSILYEFFRSGKDNGNQWQVTKNHLLLFNIIRNY